MNYSGFNGSNDLIVEYRAWTASLHPRTCLTVHWLADLGALPEPGPVVRDKALRLLGKAGLLEVVMVRSNEELAIQSIALMDNGDLDLYVAWTLWLRYVECVPKSYVLPGGQDKVLAWVRAKLRRPELTAGETQRELWWQAERMLEACGVEDEGWPRPMGGPRHN
jgi:hypothetical protein